MGSAADGFHSGEVHSEFGIQDKSEVLKLGDFEDRVRARVGGWEGYNWKVKKSHFSFFLSVRGLFFEFSMRFSMRAMLATLVTLSHRNTHAYVQVDIPPKIRGLPTAVCTSYMDA